MLMLAWAVVLASLLGSLHCVGMCGPLALWASGSSDQESPYRVAQATTLYHLGRLSLYLLMGGLAGGIGSLMQLGGNILGWQLLAGKVVGVLMIGMGSVQIWQLLALRGIARRADPVQKQRVPLSQPNLVTRWIIGARPLVFSLPLELRGLVVGLLTALLPCGWLYLFAVVAAGTASMASGILVMAAFWLGTLPALTALVFGAQQLSAKFRKILPVVAALLLIATGGFAFQGRGFAGMESLKQLNHSVPNLSAEFPQQFLEEVEQAELPCCCATK